MDVDDGVVAGAALDEVDERHLVDDRVGIRHYDNSGDATRGGGKACRLQRLAVFVAGFSSIDLRVDQPGRQHVAHAIDNLGAFRCVAPQVRADVGDHAILNDNAAGLVAVR